MIDFLFLGWEHSNDVWSVLGFSPFVPAVSLSSKWIASGMDHPYNTLINFRRRSENDRFYVLSMLNLFISPVVSYFYYSRLHYRHETGNKLSKSLQLFCLFCRWISVLWSFYEKNQQLINVWSKFIPECRNSQHAHLVWHRVVISKKFKYLKVDGTKLYINSIILTSLLIETKWTSKQL